MLLQYIKMYTYNVRNYKKSRIKVIFNPNLNLKIKQKFFKSTFKRFHRWGVPHVKKEDRFKVIGLCSRRLLSFNN